MLLICEIPGNTDRLKCFCRGDCAEFGDCCADYTAECVDSPSPCSPGELEAGGFACDGRCLPADLVCNGEPNCNRGEDELLPQCPQPAAWAPAVVAADPCAGRCADACTGPCGWAAERSVCASGAFTNFAEVALC